MSDRELLELAAKAAGYIRMKYFDDIPYVSGDMNGDDFLAWNPLADDGDALRLAVKLCLRIEIWDQDFMHNDPHVEVSFDLPSGMDGSVREPVWDAGEAARRAIVRAAAEISKAMEG